MYTERPPQPCRASRCCSQADNAGVATREDVDERALEFLTTVAPGVAETAVQEIASLDLTGVCATP